MHLFPELTALDDLANVHTGGEYNVNTDAAHCIEGGVCKNLVLGFKAICDDRAACSDQGHGVATAAAVIDDFVKISGGHNTGYHRMQAVNSLTSIHVYTFTMIRSLLFTLLGALCSVPDLFNNPLQTALISLLAYSIVLVRHANAICWTADTPGKVSAVYAVLEAWWEDIEKYVHWKRPKAHLPSHWGQLYERLGAPVHYSTMHFIEAMQRLLKSSWKHTSRRMDAAAQVMQRICVIRWIHNTLRPSTGDTVDPVAALQADRPTQAYLTGTLRAIPGINTLYSEPGVDQLAWNSSLNLALRTLAHPSIPAAHNVHADRMYPRRAGTFVREGLVAASIAAIPAGCEESKRGPLNAIFSGYDPVANPGPAPGGVAAGAAAAAAPDASDDAVCESDKRYFFVDFWISYDVTGLSAATPNAPPPGRRLRPSDLNASPEEGGLMVIDLAVGRWLTVQKSLAGGDADRETAASYVFRRVALKASTRRSMVDLGELCQPLWAMPVLGSVGDAKAYFDAHDSKWSAGQWLVTTKLY